MKSPLASAFLPNLNQKVKKFFILYSHWADIVSDNRETGMVGRAMYKGRPDWAVAQIYIFTLYPGPKFTQPTFTQNPHLHNTKFT